MTGFWLYQSFGLDVHHLSIKLEFEFSLRVRRRLCWIRTSTCQVDEAVVSHLSVFGRTFGGSKRYVADTKPFSKVGSG